MNFNKHSNLEGQHAFLGASKYHWINYSEDKVAESYSSFLATQKGTQLHEFAAQCIRLGQKLPRSHKTLNMYVNDAIGFKMIPEQVLFYSENCFGTADSIAFRNKFLRVHDYPSCSLILLIILSNVMILSIIGAISSTVGLATKISSD